MLGDILHNVAPAVRRAARRGGHRHGRVPPARGADDRQRLAVRSRINCSTRPRRSLVIVRSLHASTRRCVRAAANAPLADRALLAHLLVPSSGRTSCSWPAGSTCNRGSRATSCSTCSCCSRSACNGSGTSSRRSRRVKIVAAVVIVAVALTGTLAGRRPSPRTQASCRGRTASSWPSSRRRPGSTTCSPTRRTRRALYYYLGEKRVVHLLPGRGARSSRTAR